MKNLYQGSHYRQADYDEWLRCEEIKAAKRRERQRQRDAAFARFERENGVSERVVKASKSGTTVYRGQFCIGYRAPGYFERI